MEAQVEDFQHRMTLQLPEELSTGVLQAGSHSSWWAG